MSAVLTRADLDRLAQLPDYRQESGGGVEGPCPRPGDPNGTLTCEVGDPPSCSAGCSPVALADAVRRLVSTEPPVCPHAGTLWSHDARSCLVCTTRQMWVREQAKAELDRRRGGGAEVSLPMLTRLDDLLDEPDEETPWLIEGLWPSGGNILISAAYKAGKSTLCRNLERSLVDGSPFLGAFEVPQPVRRIVVLDLELPRSTGRRWLRRQGIAHPQRLEVAFMRGQAQLLDIRDPRLRDLWLERLTGADAAVLDCLEPVIVALGLDPNSGVRAFLDAWGGLLVEAGVGASAILHHHGHVAERPKGDSGIGAWPDALWSLTMIDGDRSSPRYFSGHGRDVEVAEGRVDFDPATGHMTFNAGAGRDVDAAVQRTANDEAKVLAALYADHLARTSRGEVPPPGGTSVPWEGRSAFVAAARSSGLSDKRIDKAKALLKGRGLLIVSPFGRHGSQRFGLSAEGLRAAAAPIT